MPRIPHGRPATGYFVAAFQPTDLPSPPILTGPYQSSTDFCRGRKTEAAAQQAHFQATWQFSDVSLAVEDL
jgi:hypothetical protein